MNIAEHIAYLIGDSKRVIIPIYTSFDDTPPPPPPPPPPMPDNTVTDNGNGNGNGNVVPDSGNGIPNDGGVPGPEQDPGAGDFYLGGGDTGIIIDDPGLTDIRISQDNNPIAQQGGMLDDTSIGDTTITTPDEEIPADYIKKYILERWLKDTMAKVSKLMPSNLKLHLNKSKVFTAGEWQDSILTGVGFNLNSLDSSDIVSINRFDGEVSYECRQIPFNLRSKARFGSGFLEECSETDPVYYINDMNLMVEPKPEDTHLDSLDGFCTIDYLGYPDLDVNSESMHGVPFDMQQIVLIGTAIRCKKFQLDSLKRPVAPLLNSEFQAPQLDNPNLVDAIEKAQKLIDDYEGSSFKDFFLDEDIDMATTALTASNQQLEIAATELAEQDKVASIYISEYSQSISKFAQNISEYGSAYKKLDNDYDMLQNEYQELIYALRGELPSKTQLRDTERKLAQIKQVVQK